jgi:hypothetical protein
MAPKTRDLGIAGWRERVSLPALGLRAIAAKIDTGARTSALHASDVETFRRGGKRHVRFGLRKGGGTRRVEATLWGERRVRSSSGHPARRPVILTVLEMGGERWVIEVGLAERGTMGFPMLLGRQAVRGRFLVDPARSWLIGKDGGARRKGPGKPRKVRTRKGPVP